MAQTKSKTDKLVKSFKAELEANEKAIEESRIVLRDMQNRTKSAELKTIQAENKLHEVEGLIKQAEADYKGKLASLDEINKGYEGRRDTIKVELDALKADVADQKAKKRLLINESKEREAYQKEQEAKIEEVIEAANSRIMDLNHEASQLESRNTQLAISFSDMEHQTNELEALIRQKTADLSEINEQYESVNRTYQQTLAGLKSRIDTAHAEYKMNVEEGKKIVDKLAMKEKELATREKIISDREYKVSQEEKMWESRHHVYNKQGV